MAMSPPPSLHNVVQTRPSRRILLCSCGRSCMSTVHTQAHTSLAAASSMASGRPIYWCEYGLARNKRDIKYTHTHTHRVYTKHVPSGRTRPLASAVRTLACARAVEPITAGTLTERTDDGDAQPGPAFCSAATFPFRSMRAALRCVCVCVCASVCSSVDLGASVASALVAPCPP